MSRFKPSRGLEPAPVHAYGAPFSAAATTALASPPETADQAASEDPKRRVRVTDMAGTLGFIALCVSWLSGSLNDWFTMLFHTPAYVSTVLVPLLPIFWLFTKNRFAGLDHKIGRWWVAFIILLFMAAPFSVWRTGTLNLLLSYVTRSYVLFFFATAFVIGIGRCRTLLFTMIGVDVLVLLTCLQFGTTSSDNRLYVRSSLFFGNSNELAMQLLLGITQFTYLLYGKGVVKKVFAGGCIVLSLIYMLRTGSRGCLLGACAYALLLIFTSRNRFLVIAICSLALLFGIAFVPSATIGRLKLIDFDEAQFQAGADVGAIESGMERKELLRVSLLQTIKHPLFGVGPGQFPVAVAGEKEKKGEHAEWLGTHNSYTQISAECGIPAFIFYVGIIVMSLVVNYRLYRATKDNPQLAQFSNFGYTMLSSCLVYAFCTFFFHAAYTGVLPTLSGLTVAAYLAARPLISDKKKTPEAAAA